jgi:superfamily II DNA or RNA helicase
MLNVRKLKQDFSQNVLKDGKALFDDKKVISVKILELDDAKLRISAKVLGQYDNTYESTIEIDRIECEMIDSDCDCPYRYDCQHIAGVLYYLDSNLDEILVNYSKEADLHQNEEVSVELLEIVKEAAEKEELRQGVQFQKEVLEEYQHCAKILAESPFFLPIEEKSCDRAELQIIFQLPADQENVKPIVEMQFALRLPSRSKPLFVSNVKDFIEGIRHEEYVTLSGKKYLFSIESFPKEHRGIIRMIIDYSRFHDKAVTEKGQRSAYIESKTFGLVLAESYMIAMQELEGKRSGFNQDDFLNLPCIYFETIEEPLNFSITPVTFNMNIEYIDPPASKVLINPTLIVDQQQVALEEVRFFECAFPGVIHNNVYYRFRPEIKRTHLQHLFTLRSMTVPHPLLGTLIENALVELSKFSKITHEKGKQFYPTMPFVGTLKAICDLSYLDGELEASVAFDYGNFTVPSSHAKLKYDEACRFVANSGVLARDLVHENKILTELFQDFQFSEETGHFVAKSDKKIIEFMTEIVPRFNSIVTFNCPQNLLDQFIYDKTHFSLNFVHLDRMDAFLIELKVDGELRGCTMDRLWECILAKRAFLELESPKTAHKKGAEKVRQIPKILVLNLEEMQTIAQLFDELGIMKLDNHKFECPIWSLANIDASNFLGLPVDVKISEKLMDIRRQMLGEKTLEFSAIPSDVKAELRSYQKEGVHWLERLRGMYLSGILADDMGLGKTLQAITSITQIHGTVQQATTIIVCPTSLLYNWYEEFKKFNPSLKVAVIDGIPGQRKKLIKSVSEYDVVITTYSLIQKDIELYEGFVFKYVVLDEAQHIKNRATRNAKSVKQINAEHRLILSGTPIENSLDELWSLFDFLMPRFLGTYDRFIERYVRPTGEELTKNLQYLRKKVSPFILRRMKADVLNDLPPVSEIVYHTQLTPVQQELYRSYAASAKDELTRLVERDGFDKVQIHVLATLTRLKQICCHPGIFAKETPEPGDSAKYEMLVELLNTLIEGGHKTVIFSQYTKMLQIIRDDLEKAGIRFCYLDGSSKNRLELVKQFNEDPNILVFLVSLKAGGTGLNLTGADTVIHYDMWWNPAVQSQATDRVHRLGQDKNVSVYKLITKSTIEEKIVEMQERKKGLVKKVVTCDEEALAKLTWEDVLQLLDA